MLTGFSNALTSELVDDGGLHLTRLYEGSDEYSLKHKFEAQRSGVSCHLR